MKRCLSCGHTFQVEEESEMRQVEGEGVEALPETVKGGGMNSMENDEFSVFEPAATPVVKSRFIGEPLQKEMFRPDSRR
jgi:hypothetical protein